MLGAPLRMSSAGAGELAPVALTALLAGLLLVPLACVQFVGAGASENAADPFYEYMRPRVGYFSRYDQSSPYPRIYETYFQNVLLNTDRAASSMSTDDWRKVRPAGELCVDWLTGLTVRSYVMVKPYELIILDACLDWLFDESQANAREERATDVGRFDSSHRASVAALERDQKLRQIYESTRFRDQSQVPTKLQDDIYAYVQRLLGVFNENFRSGCHAKWLEAYNDFIDDVYVGDCDDETQCQFYGGLEDADKDSYLRMLAESTREASKSCYRVMQTQMRGLMETEFEQSNSGPTTLAKRLLKTQVSRQLEREKWAREMVSILQLASGIDQETPVNLGDVVGALDRIKAGDEETIRRFAGALSEYAKHNVDLKDSANDPNGRGRFGKAMGKLCRPYTDLAKFLAATGGINTDDDPNERRPFEFYTLIYSLVRITNHEDIFGVTKEQFENDVVSNRWEALYLATFACQIISTTWGELNYETNKGEFTVLLRPDSSIMIADWPIEVLQQKLPYIYPKSGSGGGGSGGVSGAIASVAKAPREHAAPKAMFGRKFKINFRSSTNKHNRDEEPASTTTPPPPAPLPGLTALLDEPTGPAQQQQQQQQQQHVVQQQHRVASLPTAAPASRALLQPARESARDPPIMSLESIYMFRDLHGHYPRLPDYYKRIYPELPDDLSGEYPKKLGQARPNPSPSPGPRPFEPAARAQPAAPKPTSAPLGGAFGTPARSPIKPDYSGLVGLRF